MSIEKHNKGGQFENKRFDLEKMHQLTEQETDEYIDELIRDRTPVLIRSGDKWYTSIVLDQRKSTETVYTQVNVAFAYEFTPDGMKDTIPTKDFLDMQIESSSLRIEINLKDVDLIRDLINAGEYTKITSETHKRFMRDLGKRDVAEKDS
ncbi:MAG: hypothetical protein Q8Q18_02305 [bacterium]|nr:hypothetical protein [bacterium]